MTSSVISRLESHRRNLNLRDNYFFFGTGEGGRRGREGGRVYEAVREDSVDRSVKGKICLDGGGKGRIFLKGIRTRESVE